MQQDGPAQLVRGDLVAHCLAGPAHARARGLVPPSVTALQLMFTGCSATCPIQGALFAQAQRDLKLAPGIAQFVSLSIDPLSDDPGALSAWLRKFSARAGWLAAAPRIDDVDAIVALLGSGGQPVANSTRDPHTGQVYLIDRQGALVYRLPSLPPPSDINAALVAVAQRA